MNILITNPDIYSNIIDVDLNLTQRAFSGSFIGSVVVETEAGKKTFTGEFGASNFEEEYGFKIVNN